MKKLDKLLNRIATLYEVKTEDLLNGNRKSPHVDARQVFSIIASRDLDFKYREIGRYLSMDHSSISTMCTKREIRPREEMIIDYLTEKLEEKIPFLAASLLEEPDNQELQTKMLKTLVKKL